MPNQTIFIPSEEYPYVIEQYQKPPRTDQKILEISIRSKSAFGKSLSPFTLAITLKSGKRVKVECAYQGSKIIKGGKQFPELYWGSPRDASLDQRIKGVPPIGFNFFGKEYPIRPKHTFFDFLYIVSLLQRKTDPFEQLDEFDAYSDMFYSHSKDPHCQGRAAAKYVSLIRQGLLSKETPSKELLSILIGDE